MDGVYNTLKQFVDYAANWLEAIGFLISIGTFIFVFFVDKKIVRFNKRHLLQTRVDEHIADLKNISANTINLITNFDQNKTFVRAEIKKSENQLKSIKKIILIKEDISETKRCLKDIRHIGARPLTASRFKKKEFNQEAADEFYTILTGYITYVENIKKDNSKTLI